MKVQHGFVILALVIGMLGCKKHITMKIYGDLPALDSELNHLAQKHKLLGTPLVIASKYENPDIVIVNGLDAKKKVLRLYRVDIQICDSLGWTIEEKHIGNKQAVFIFGINTTSTKKGINAFVQNVKP